MRTTTSLVAMLLMGLAGCRGVPVIVDNPATVAQGSYDFVWEQTIAVVERYFDVAYENRYDGRIETQPLSAATLFEPWLADTPGLAQRTEATLQSIRRRAFLQVQPAPCGGFTIAVEVYKELENLPQPVFAQFGGGTFISSIQPVGEAPVVSPITPSYGWISLGRDGLMEARLLAEIQKKIDLLPAR